MSDPVWGNSARKPQPKKGGPQGNPQEYLDDTSSPDGIPLDRGNPEHLSSTNEKLLTLLREYGLDPIEAGMDHDGCFATFHSLDDAKKARDLFKRAGYGEPKLDYSVDRGYRVQTSKKDEAPRLKKGEGFDPKGASLGGESKLDDYSMADGEPGKQPDDDIIHDEKKKWDFMHGDANEQEPGKTKGLLAGVVEHEGHSAAITANPEGGFVVLGRGSARYIRSEPITKKEHAEEFAKEALKAHAKLTEREVVSRNSTVMGAEGDARLDWGSVPSKEKKKLWESLTGGATHKITACMNKVDGHVDDPGAYCKSLADEVGYKPQ